MKFICYTGWNQLPESASALFVQGEKDSIFFSRAWFENVSATLEHDQVLVLACVVLDDSVLALLPLVKSGGIYWQALKHRYSTHYSMLVVNEVSPQVFDCLARGLDAMSLHSILLEPVAEDDRRLAALQRALERVGYHCEFHFRLYNWIYRVQGQSYTEYMAARPARLRNTIARKKRKLEREQGYEMRLFKGKEVPQVMPEYYAVFHASWKANEQYVDFLNSVVADFSEPGWSRLAMLYVKGQPIAAQLWFILHDKASIFRLVYDERWKQYSPGSILTSFLMEYVIDTDKVKEIDFLTGDEAYKQDWMSARRERFALSCVKRLKSTGRVGKLVGLLKRIVKWR